MVKPSEFLIEFKRAPLLALFHFIIRSNLFISIGAATSTVETLLYLGYPVHWNLVGMNAAATLFLYNADRLFVLRHLAQSQLPRHRWIVSNKKLLWIIMLIGAGISGLLLFTLSPSSLITLGILTFFTLAYAIPLLGRSLRTIPGIKTALLIITWVGVCMVVPIMENHTPIWDEKILLALLERVFFLFLMAVCFDIRDVVQDEKMSIQTIPVIIGAYATRRWSLLLMLLGAAATSLFPATRYLAPVYGLFGVLMAINMRHHTELFYGIAIDGLLILRCLSLWFSNPFDHFEIP